VLYLVSCSLKRIRFVPLLFTTTRALLVVGDAEEVVKISRARIFVLVVIKKEVTSANDSHENWTTHMMICKRRIRRPFRKVLLV